LQRKFHALVKNIEMWYRNDINNVVMTCIILHNWMVRVQLSKDETEHEDWYDPAPDDPDNTMDRDKLD
jgi:hypothetical protein